MKKKKTVKKNFIWEIEGSAWGDAKNVKGSTDENGKKDIEKITEPPSKDLGLEIQKVEDDHPNPRELLDEKLIHEAIEVVLKTLSEREYLVIKAYFFEGLSIAAIARKFKVTRERIGQVHAKALRKLRHPERKLMMKKFNIPLAEDWYDKKAIKKLEEVKENLIPTKPDLVKVEFNNGVPYLAADVIYIWQVKPVTRRTYKAWLDQAMEEHEAIHRRKGSG